MQTDKPGPQAAEQRQVTQRVLTSHHDTRGPPRAAGTVLRRKSPLSTVALLLCSGQSPRIQGHTSIVAKSRGDTVAQCQERGTNQNRALGIFTLKVSLRPTAWLGGVPAL